MRIARHDLNTDVLIVAEIGNNHEGDVTLATDLVHRAADAGADAVKFQTIVPERLVARTEAARLDQLRRFALTRADFERLADVAAARDVLFLSTPFDPDCVDWLDALVPAFKIASGDNDYDPLLDRVADTGKPVMMSTGFVDLDGAARAAARVRDRWHARSVDQHLALLHCVAAYPTPPEDANLRAIGALGTLGVTVGYSDHTLGTDAAVIAVAAGARIVEKHFTIAHDHSPFRDHALSADPAQMRELVRRIRAAERLLGTGRKQPTPTETASESAVRRTAVAMRPLAAGHVVEPKDLDWVRAARGVRCSEIDRIVGRPLVRSLDAGDPVHADLWREEGV
ncbi:MAG: N-acetylneuraminate synthase family protein [Phycisphaerales bacterium]|nr:N-acetylneuraminate synthase family protein [Phycisphaerales bacterium]